MMEAIVAKNTPIGEFKKQIEVEAKKQGVECELKANRWQSHDMTSMSHDSAQILSQ